MKKRYKNTNRIFHKFLKFTIGKYIRIRYGLNADTSSIKGIKPPYMVFANHVNFWDPFMVSIFIKHPIHFVTSDEYFRNTILKLLLKLVGGIPKAKFISDSDTVKKILRVRNNNGVVGVYPEGERSWDGNTLKILYPTAKLVKKLEVPVVCAVLKGGCISYPRWADRPRFGTINIDYKLVLKSEEIKGMSTAKIYDRLTVSLSHNEYEYQRAAMIPYHGKKLAESLELFLFTCPSCNSLGKQYSDKDKFICGECGYSVTYDRFGFLKSNSKKNYFDNTADWNHWQLSRLHNTIITSKDEQTIFEDKGAVLKKGRRMSPFRVIRLGKAEFQRGGILFKALLKKDTIFFDIHSINGINVQYNKLFEFYYMGDLYRITFTMGKISAYKWAMALNMAKRIITQKKAAL